MSSCLTHVLQEQDGLCLTVLRIPGLRYCWLLMGIEPLTLSVPTAGMTQMNALAQSGEPLDAGHLHSLLGDSCPINVTTFVASAGSFRKEAKNGGFLLPGVRQID